MRAVLLLATFICAQIQLSGQTLSFSDFGLKQLLLLNNCVDTNSDGQYDHSVDLNLDGEIQVSEALSVTSLEINDLYREYYIKHLNDIRHFDNLEQLRIYSNDSLAYIGELGLDSLKLFWLDGSAFSLKHCDLSDLAAVNSLRIEGPFVLEYLNIQNGSFADESFSLFYTEYIQYACVDSIAAEYNEVSWHMNPGAVPSVICALSQEEPSSMEIRVFPNPTSGVVHIDNSLHDVIEVVVYDPLGRQVLKVNSKHVSLRGLPAGSYLFAIRTLEGIFYSRVIKN